jgi:HAD superfamily hydrolase (TIGR01548 family)
VTPADIAARKAAGQANDDWAVTADLLRRAGRPTPRDVVVAEFQRHYVGSGDEPGLRARERLLLSRERLAALAGRRPLAVVTGRPRAEAEDALQSLGIREHFRAVITRDDAPLKPDPAPLTLALAALGVRRAWMIGDTPDDILAARRAGVLPLGVLPPGPVEPSLEAALYRAGAARVAHHMEELSTWLP